jgi:hypothetical protein
MLKIALPLLLLLASFQVHSCFESEPHPKYSYYFEDAKDSDVNESFNKRSVDEIQKKAVSIDALQKQISEGDIRYTVSIFNVSYSHGYSGYTPVDIPCDNTYHCLTTALDHFETEDSPAIEEVFIYSTNLHMFTVDIMTKDFYRRYHINKEGMYRLQSENKATDDHNQQ